MKATITHKNQPYQINLSKPIDISIPLRGNKENLNAWDLKAMKRLRNWTAGVGSSG